MIGKNVIFFEDHLRVSHCEEEEDQLVGRFQGHRRKWVLWVHESHGFSERNVKSIDL